MPERYNLPIWITDMISGPYCTFLVGARGCWGAPTKNFRLGDSAHLCARLDRCSQRVRGQKSLKCSTHKKCDRRRRQLWAIKTKSRRRLRKRLVYRWVARIGKDSGRRRIWRRRLRCWRQWQFEIRPKRGFEVEERWEAGWQSVGRSFVSLFSVCFTQISNFSPSRLLWQRILWVWQTAYCDSF